MDTNKETLVAEIDHLDKKGNGHAVLWRESTGSNLKKLQKRIENHILRLNMFPYSGGHPTDEYCLLEILVGNK